jgi:hypothetical protein
MTWYANEILASGSDAVIRAIGRDSLLAPFAYHVAEPLDHAWHTSEVVHGLPTGGLVVVRPVCDATPDESPADWYGEPVLDWRCVSGPADSRISALLARLAEATSRSIDNLAPIGLLSRLKSLAKETASPFVFYDCSMWGGDIECEYAFVFGSSELALVSLESAVPAGRRPVGIIEPSQPMRVEAGDTLVLALRHLSFDLPTPFFMPHTRSFPWTRYRLVAEPA